MIDFLSGILVVVIIGVAGHLVYHELYLYGGLRHKKKNNNKPNQKEELMPKKDIYSSDVCWVSKNPSSSQDFCCCGWDNGSNTLIYFNINDQHFTYEEVAADTRLTAYVNTELKARITEAEAKKLRREAEDKLKFERKVNDALLGKEE